MDYGLTNAAIWAVVSKFHWLAIYAQLLLHMKCMLWLIYYT